MSRTLSAGGLGVFASLYALIGRLKACQRGPALVVILFAAIPALLFLPVLYYSLTTPFALVDDLGVWGSVLILDSPGQFFRWFDREFLNLGADAIRFRPFWEFYDAVSWKIFGPTPWLHHLARWIFHFGAVFAFGAAFLCFVRKEQSAQSAASWFVRLLPLAVLAYVWLFFPNQPAARLGPQEVYTVFFLGLCTWMMALMLLREGREVRLRSTLLVYGLFCLGFFGLAWSKEVNIAVMLWLLVCYFVVLLIGAMRQKRAEMGLVQVMKAISLWKVLGGLPLALVFAHTLVTLYAIEGNGGYGTASLTPGLIVGNARWMLGQLFQVNTSLFITAGFALLLGLLLLFIVDKVAKKQFSNELIFALFLMGQFVSLYLILCTSWMPVLRYWYILIPVFAMLLAFSAKFTLEFAGTRQPLSLRLGVLTLPPPRVLVAFALVGLTAIFIYISWTQALRFWYILIPVFAMLPAFSAKFILEFVGARQPFRLRLGVLTLPPLPPRLLVAFALVGFIGFFVCCNYYNFLFQTVVQHSVRSTEAKLLDEIIRLHDQGEYLYVPFESPDELLAKIVGYPNGDYHGFLARFHGRGYEVHTEPPEEVGRPYYTVRHGPGRYNLPAYRPLAYARSVAGALQSDGLYWSQDDGAGIRDWYVYDDELDYFWRNGLNERRIIEEAGEPIIQSFFDVYHTGDGLMYVKDQCAPEDVEAEFFLHVEPVDKSDLPHWRKRHGFDAIGIAFEDYGIKGGGRCIVEFEAPAYEISRITVGQWIPGEGRTWSSRINWAERE